MKLDDVVNWLSRTHGQSGRDRQGCLIREAATATCGLALLASLVAGFGATPASAATSTLTSGLPGPAVSTIGLPVLTPGAPQVPLPPATPGCYLYSSGHWVLRACLSPASVLRQGPPPLVAVGEFPPGISTGPQGSGAIVLDGSYVADYSIGDSSGSESDTTYGPNAWSLQDNTNDFAGLNGHTDWVQFAFQDFGSWDRTCIWQVDVTVANATNNAAGYDPTGCYGAAQAPVSIWGYDYRNPNGPPTLGMLTLTNSGIYQASVALDIYGLASNGNWVAASGGILGSGGGSQAVFSPGWREAQEVGATDCYFGPPCSSGKLPSSTSVFTSNVTAESSNLTTPFLPTLFFGKSRHWAYVEYLSTAP